MAKTASKNNPTKRKSGAVQKLFNGKVVKPVRYIDTELGHNYMAAQYDDGSMVMDDSKPLKWMNL